MAASLRTGVPCGAGTVASGASSPGVSGLGALSVFLKRNGFLSTTPGCWLSVRVCEGRPSGRGEHGDARVHTRLRKPPGGASMCSPSLRTVHTAAPGLGSWYVRRGKRSGENTCSDTRGRKCCRHGAPVPT